MTGFDSDEEGKGIRARGAANPCQSQWSYLTFHRWVNRHINTVTATRNNHHSGTACDLHILWSSALELVVQPRLRHFSNPTSTRVSYQYPGRHPQGIEPMNNINQLYILKHMKISGISPARTFRDMNE
jgi:hypothetical protein